MSEIQSTTSPSTTPEPMPSGVVAPVVVSKRRSSGVASKRKRFGGTNLLDLGSENPRYWRHSKNKREEFNEGDAAMVRLQQRTRRSWQDMFQSRYENCLWIGVEQVLFRVLQVPRCNRRSELEELVSLQVDRLSPWSMAQTVWSFDVVPDWRGERQLQTVLVEMAKRDAVEELIGKSLDCSMRPDRVEVPVRYQMQSILSQSRSVDGAWIFPKTSGQQVSCLVAWWQEGVLHHIEKFNLSSVSGVDELTQCLSATSWAGEMEGWLTKPCVWHLVSDGRLSEQWLPALKAWSGQDVDWVAPIDAGELALLSAARATGPVNEANLLPPDFRDQFRRDDVDRAWGWTTVCIALFVMLGVGAFFGVLKWKGKELAAAEKRLRTLDPKYKETLRLKQQSELLEEQIDLGRVALDCLHAVAASIPENVTLDRFTFTEVKSGEADNLVLRGTADEESQDKIGAFFDALGKYTVKDPDEENEEDAAKKPKQRNLFRDVKMPRQTRRTGGLWEWSITAKINREEPK